MVSPLWIERHMDYYHLDRILILDGLLYSSIYKKINNSIADGPEYDWKIDIITGIFVPDMHMFDLEYADVFDNLQIYSKKKRFAKRFIRKITNPDQYSARQLYLIAADMTVHGIKARIPAVGKWNDEWMDYEKKVLTRFFDQYREAANPLHDDYVWSDNFCFSYLGSKIGYMLRPADYLHFIPSRKRRCSYKRQDIEPLQCRVNGAFFKYFMSEYSYYQAIIDHARDPQKSNEDTFEVDRRRNADGDYMEIMHEAHMYQCTVRERGSRIQSISREEMQRMKMG